MIDGRAGAGVRSIWIFQLANYAALDRLLRDGQAEVARVFRDFFTQIPMVVDKVREEFLIF